MANDDSRIPRAATISGVENPERLLRRARRASPSNRRKERGHVSAEKLPLLPNEEETGVDTFHTVADQVVSEERPAHMFASPVSRWTSEQIFVRDAVAGIPTHVEEALIRFLTNWNGADGPTGDNRALALLEGFVLRTIDEALQSPEVIHRITEPILNSPGFITPVAALVKAEQRQPTEEQARIEARCHQFIEAGANLNQARKHPVSAHGEEPLTDILDDARTSPRAYSKSTPQSSSDWNERPRRAVKGGKQRYQETRKNAVTPLDAEGLVVLKPMNDLVTDAVDYRQYRLLKKSVRDDDDVAHELSRMTKKVAVQMKDRTFSERDPVSIIAFLQDFKAACDACSIHERAALWLFKHFLTGPVEAVIKARVALPTKTSKAQEGCLTSYSAVVNFLLKRCATDDNLAVVDGDIRQFRQGTLTATEYAQLQWTKTLCCASVYTEKIIKGMFVEGVNRPICRALRQW